jgi:fibronectin-binding autotransporter adhesin
MTAKSSSLGLRLLRWLCGISLAAFFAARATAAPMYWTSGGTWDQSLLWADTSGGTSGSGYTLAWSDSSDAVFEGTAGTVNIAGSVSPYSLTFAKDGYLLTGGSITLPATGALVTTGTGTDTIASVIQGSGGISKAGPGILLLTGDNSYSGGTTVHGGMLSLSGSGGIADTLVDGGTLAMAGSGQYTTFYEYVGYGGNGTLIHSGAATNNPLARLYIGYNAGANGSYVLSGTGLLTGGTQYIGYSGTGTFTQSGGSNTRGMFLSLGYKAGSSGSYSMSGSAILSMGEEDIGCAGRGAFIQSGGTNSLNSLMLGASAGGSGSYDLSDNGLLSAYNQNIGWYSQGVVNQSGGTNVANGELDLGCGSTSAGTYNLSGSAFLSAASEYVGRGGPGVFNQSGGLNVAGGDWSTGNFYIGYTSSGTYNLSGTGSLRTPSESVGYGHSGVFFQSGGTHNVGSVYGLGTGTLSIGDIGDGTYILTNSGLLSAAAELVGKYGPGTFIHSGGTNNVGTLELACNMSSNASYTLSGSGVLSAGNEYVGYYGYGSFVQSGGTNSVSGVVQVGSQQFSNGNYTLTGSGVLSAAYEYMGSSNAAGCFIQSGGTNDVSTQLSGSSYSLSNSGVLNAANEYLSYFSQSSGTNTVTGTFSSGTYALSGGVLNIRGIQYNGLYNFLNQSGGTVTVSQSLWLQSSGIFTYALTGGVLIVPSITNYGASFNFGGGTLAASQAFSASQPLSLDGSASLDTGIYSIALTGKLYGMGGLNKLGAGCLTLTGTNTYSGGTTISAGTLQLGDGRHLNGTLASGVVDNGTLEFANPTAQAYGWAIAGSGCVTVDGGGPLTLSGANSYSGGTTVSGSLLKLGNPAALGAVPSILCLSGGTVDLAGNSLAVGLLTGSGNITCSSGACVLTLNPAAPLVYNGTISNGYASLGIVKCGDSALTLESSNAYGGGTTLNGGTLKLGNDNAIGYYDLTLTSGTLSSDGTGDHTLSMCLNIAGSVTLGDVNNSGKLSFSRTDGTIRCPSQITVNSPVTIAAAVAESTSGTGLILAGASTLTLTGSCTYSGGTTVNGLTLMLGSGGTTGSVVGPIVDNGVLILNRCDSFTIGGAISGSGSLTKLGPGTCILGGYNTLGGGITVASGSLQWGSGGASGSPAGPIADNGVLIFNASNTVICSGSITGTGAIYQMGPGALVLSGSNVLTGGVTISGGTLQWGSGGAAGTLSGPILDNGTLVLDCSDSFTYAGSISGSGGLSHVGPASVLLTGWNSYSGNTTVSGGTLKLGNGSSGSVPSGSVFDDGMVICNFSNTVTLPGTISGSGSLVQTGPGILVLAGTNTFTGGTTISGGTLIVGKGGASGWLPGSVLDNGALVLNRSDTVTYNTAVNGSGGLLQFGPGKLILTSANSYSGGTTVSGGTLQLGNGGNSGSVTGGVLLASGNLAFNRSDALSFEQVISGGGGLFQLGAGAIVLTGANSYSGGTTISSGTLQLGSGGVSGAIGNTVALVDNGMFVIDRSDDVTAALWNSRPITGSGGLAQIGGGNLTLNLVDTAFTGATAVSNGTLTVANPLALLYSPVTVMSPGVLAIGVISATLGGLAGDGNVSLVSGTTRTALTVSIKVPSSFGGTLSGVESLTTSSSSCLTLNGTGTSTLGLLAITGTSSLTLSSGTINCTGIAVKSLGSGLTAAGGVLNIATISGYSLSVGTLTSGATFTLNAGSAAISGGSLSFTSSTTGVAHFIQNGGSFTFSSTTAGDWLNTRNLTFDLAGGQFTATDYAGIRLYSSLGGSTTLNVGGGTGTALVTLNPATRNGTGPYLSHLSSDTTAINLKTGGTLIVGGFSYGDAGVSQMNFNGGTLQASSSNVAFIPVTSYVSVAIQDHGGTIDSGGNNITVGNALMHSGVAQTDGGFIKAGSGVLTLSGSNTYTGGTTISGGTLQLAAAGALPNGANTGNLAVLGGVLDIGGRAIAVKAMAGSGTITSSAPGTLVITAGSGDATSTFSGSIQNGNATVGLVKTGTGTLIISGSNTYSGGTTINAGTLAMANSATLGSGPLSLGPATLRSTGANVLDHVLLLTASAGTLDTPAPADALTLAAQVTGAGGLTKTGSGTLVLASSDALAANNYQGPTTVQAGTLLVDTSESLSAASTLTIGDGASVILNFGGAAGGGQSLPAFDLPEAIAAESSDVDIAPMLVAAPAGVAAVPEPGTLALLAAGMLGGLSLWLRRRATGTVSPTVSGRGRTLRRAVLKRDSAHALAADLPAEI